MKQHSLWIIALVCCMPLYAQNEEKWGSVSGHVYTAEGKPLADARIEVFPLQSAVAGPLPAAISDSDGAYHLASPALGLTRICARREDLGYPKTQYKLFSSGTESFPEVQLVSSSELKDVDIHLGPPDGSIEGIVVDRATQAAIGFARVSLRWAEDPSVSFSSSISQSGEFRYALPKRHITLVVTAPGYRQWSYADPGTHEAFLDIKPWEHKTVTIELEKSSNRQ